MDNKIPHVEPVAGQVIRQSMLAALGMLAFLIVAFVLGIVMVWAWWTGTELAPPIFGSSSDFRRWEGATGAILAAGAGLIAVMNVMYLFAKEKLILGSDRLQIMQRDQVVAQIPFHNIARLALADDEGVKFIGIDLKDPGDPATFVEVWDFQASKVEDGWHYRLIGVFERGLDEIHDLLASRVRAGAIT